MPEQTAEARIRDLERRLDLDPGSRLFVSLAEEYRKVGRVKDALSALQKGLLAHPGYVAAQVALGRVYVEANLNSDAIATFTKVLASDPGNLVAAKSLADIYYARGDNLEALKKFKLYRALSGDRKVDDLIAKIEPQVAPKPITPLKKILGAEPAPPPPSFHEAEKTAARRPTHSRLPVPSSELSDPFDVTSLAFEPGEDSGKGAEMDGPFSGVPTRDVFIPPPPSRSGRAPVEAASAAAPSEQAPVPPAVEPVPEAAVSAAPEPVEPAPPPPVEDLEQTLSVRAPVDSPGPRELFAAEAPPPKDLPEPPPLFLSAAGSAEAGEVRIETPAAAAPVSLEPREFPPAWPAETPSPTPPPLPATAALAADSDEQTQNEGEAEPGAPTGRALADLYYAQGHYAEALQIYDDLVTRHPFDDDLKRMRRDAEARLLPAASTPAVSSQDPGLERRLSRVRVLKRWLGRIQGDSERSTAAPGP